MAKTKITVRARGPLLVEGELEGKTRVLLCRCGASKTRPLCDGSHYRTDFECPE
jgi:CDGSH-type Zn-finger protein